MATDETPTPALEDVLLQIARCPTGRPPAAPPRPPSSDCRDVVASQGTTKLSSFQVPEPWRGDLINAPLLFISSNPGWNPEDDSPTAIVPDAGLIDYFTKRGFPPEFPRNRNKNGRANPRAVSFWASIRNRAAELFAMPPERIVAGAHFALTEVVHCKSAKEHFAYNAASECARRHMAAVVQLSLARVVVVFGDLAAATLNVAAELKVTERIFHGRKRVVAWLPHPNARKARTFRTYSPADLELLRTRLKA